MLVSLTCKPPLSTIALALLRLATGASAFESIQRYAPSSEVTLNCQDVEVASGLKYPRQTYVVEVEMLKLLICVDASLIALSEPLTKDAGSGLSEAEPE